MQTVVLESLLALCRRKTNELLDAIEISGSASTILGWRPGPGRAHIAWQLMHIAATEDRHLNVRMTGGEAIEPDLVRRFAGGSVPDDDIPTIDAIRSHLATRRDALLAHLRQLSEEAMDRKPNEQAAWAYGEWFQLLAWHEAHHHGQAHLTFNLYRATHDASLARVGH